MKTLPASPPGRLPAATLRERGFALVVTLMMMMLLMVLAVGMLTLSVMTLRAGSQGESAARARANARMALMLAIGQLQEQAGPDTRVTARADVLDEKNGLVLGVWRSWEGSDHVQAAASQGRPIAPGYATEKKNRFLGWMISGDPAENRDYTQVPSTDGSGSTDTVTLVGENTVGSGGGRDKLQVHLTPMRVQLKNSDGGIAWWVSGENMKARLPKPYQIDAGSSSGRWASVEKSHTVADTKPFGMETLLTDASPADRAITLESADFIGEQQNGLGASKAFFHDLSTTSYGLLTNTATGGWRKDMSTLTENWGLAASSGLPFFRATPTADVLYNKPTSSNPTPAKAMLYPWASYRGSSSDMAIYRQGAVASWENLKEYALMYRNANMSSSANGRCRVNAMSYAIDGDVFGFIHRVRVLPVVARIQWVFSYYALSSSTPGSYQPVLVMNPVITMWNPYNVELNLPSAGNTPALSFNILKPLPPVFTGVVNGVAVGPKATMTGSNYGSFSPANTLTYNITSGFTLKPGETRIFSPQGSSPVAMGSALTLTAGYHPSCGHYIPLLPAQANGLPGTAPASASIEHMSAKFDAVYEDAGQQGVGIYLDMSVGDAVRHLAYRMVYTPKMADVVYTPLTDLSSTTLAEAKDHPIPFLSTIFGARMASNTIEPSKGFVQSSPLVNYTAMGLKDIAESTIARHYLGTSNPINSPFDYSFVSHTSGNDDRLPNATDTRSFIVSGFSKADGLSRCVIDELPTRPLQSLCELQNWDLRYENPIPPYCFNIIGNSDATPLIPSNAAVDSSNTSSANAATNLQYDDSYCANHVLFDDWFFSSIAPDPDSYGNSGRDMRTTFSDFISGAKPLPNRAYQPIAADLGGNAASLYAANVTTRDGWKTIASHLEVEGMFNVNSTSTTAWRALLGHARNQLVPYYQEAGTSWQVGVSSKTDHAQSRFSFAGDAQTGASGSSGAFPGASEFTGYRVLTDAMLDQLATDIVKQVRLRGPFLSLSEFVNRQLSSGNLALAGTVQTALNQLAQGASNPYGYLQGASLDARVNPIEATPNDEEYRYRDAAAGKCAYGLPGWTRQADILRPLAPILSARDDTFTIRAHGDDRDINGKIVSRAICEAVVRRMRNYVDPQDKPDLATPPVSTINKTFGRRFEVVSLRWLEPSEI